MRVGIGRLYLVVVLAAIGCQAVSAGQDKSLSPANGTKTGSEGELDRQLQINRSALLEGTSDAIRTVAATEILLSDNRLARKILIDALGQTANIGARTAVCKALSQARASQELFKVKNKEDFILPLLDILASGDSDIAGLAAEATLVFDYEQISGPVETLIEDLALPVKSKLHAIYALELHPDMRAAIKLLELVDSPQPQVAAAAEQALSSLGIPTGQDAEGRRKIIQELSRSGSEAFLVNQLIRRQSQMRDLRAELKSWKDRYRSALDTIYVLKDDAAKGKLLVDSLADTRPVVRSWALDKVRESRVAPGPQKLPSELEPVLIGLISDREKDVRLKTAEVLSFMVELNSAERLLAQLQMEKDDEVRLAIFVALGGTCFYDISLPARNKIPPEIRRQTLEWAARYLSDQDSVKARRGAEVMKKLLEQDGLTDVEVDRYLLLLGERYDQAKSDADGKLRAELLSAMAGLCAPQSVRNIASKRLFRSCFDEALSDKADLVREAAIEGLIYVDPAIALKRLRKDFANDTSAVVRKQLISLAAKVGGKDDLGWLAEKVGSNAESDLAWQAMLAIFSGSDAVVLGEWTNKFFSPSGTARLSDEQKITFLEITEAKATAENDAKMVKTVMERLSGLYILTGRFQKAETYLLRLRGSSLTAGEKDAVLSGLTTVYLRWPKLDLVVELATKCLQEKDLDPNNGLVRSVEEYLGRPSGGAEPNDVLKALAAVEVRRPEARLNWQRLLKEWQARVGKTLGPEVPRDVGRPKDDLG